MKYTVLIIMAFVMSIYAHGQRPTDYQGSLAGALKTLPSRTATNTVNLLSFTNMLENHINDSSADVAESLPLLKQYLNSSNIELRRMSLLTVHALSRRPDSATELASLLPDVYSQLDEEDTHLRLVVLLVVETLQPKAPDDASAALISSLGKASVSDDYGVAISEGLARIRPNDDGAQSAIIAYLNRPGLDDNHKADVIEAIANPNLGDRATQVAVDLANTTSAGRLRNAAIISCSKIGPRAVNRIKDTLDVIQANASESAEAHEAAHRALNIIQR